MGCPKDNFGFPLFSGKIGFQRSMTVFLSIVLLFLVSASGVPAGAAEEDARIQALEARLSAEREKLEVSYGREKDLVARVEVLELELKRGKAEISRLKELIRHAEEEQSTISRELESLEEMTAVRQRAVADKLLALYKHARGGYMRMLFGVDGLDPLRRTVKYVTSMMEEDARILDAHAAAVRDYRRRKAALQADLLEKKKVTESQQRSVADIELHLEEVILKLVNVHREKEFYETAVRELQLASGEFRNTITAIEKRADGGVTTEASGDDLMGSLPLPADGSVIVSGAAEPGAARSGVFVEAQPGARVRAVLPGRVEFSGPVKGYGQTVIINHGGRLYSVSSQLSRPDVREGTAVEAGEQIGVAGARDGKGIVYFEIRYAGRPVDARLWLQRE